MKSNTLLMFSVSSAVKSILEPGQLGSVFDGWVLLFLVGMVPKGRGHYDSPDLAESRI